MMQPSNDDDEQCKRSRRLPNPLSSITMANKKAAFWLTIWTLNNIAVTLLNKAAFGTFIDFPYPYALTAVHMFVCAIASHVWSTSAVDSSKTTTTAASSPSEKATISRFGSAAFSVLFTLNICLGNVSLRYASINLNQVIRSLVPVFTMWLGYCSWFPSKPASLQRRRSVWPVVGGVALACFGVIDDTVFGVLVTLLCTGAAAFKVVASSQLLVQTSPLELLRSMTPPACVQCIVLSLVTKEAIWEREIWSLVLLDPATVLVVLLSGVAAFGLNITAFEAYRATSPVTCCIAAAVKQVLLVAVATALFKTRVTMINCIGMVMVLAGSAYYSYLAVLEKESSGKESKPVEEDDEERVALTSRNSSAAVQRR